MPALELVATMKNQGRKPTIKVKLQLKGGYIPCTYCWSIAGRGNNANIILYPLLHDFSFPASWGGSTNAALLLHPPSLEEWVPHRAITAVLSQELLSDGIQQQHRGRKAHNHEQVTGRQRLRLEDGLERREVDYRKLTRHRQVFLRNKSVQQSI